MASSMAGSALGVARLEHGLRGLETLRGIGTGQGRTARCRLDDTAQRIVDLDLADIGFRRFASGFTGHRIDEREPRLRRRRR